MKTFMLALAGIVALSFNLPVFAQVGGTAVTYVVNSCTCNSGCRACKMRRGLTITYNTVSQGFTMSGSGGSLTMKAPGKRTLNGTQYVAKTYSVPSSRYPGISLQQTFTHDHKNIIQTTKFIPLSSYH